MLKHESNKLFYDKYLYKVEVRSPLATIFRNKNLAGARETLDELQHKLERKEQLVMRSFLREEHITPRQLHEAQIIYTLFTQNVDFKIRIEKPTISVYSNDKEYLLNFCYKLQQECNFFEPPEEYKNILENDPNTIILNNEVPYEYRVVLGNQKTNQFRDWLATNPDKVKASNKLLDYLQRDRYVDGQLLYVRDEKIIQILSLMNVNIRRIDKIVCKQNLDK